MADKNLDGNGLNEVWIRAAQLVKKYTGAVDLTKGNLQTQVDTKITGTDDTKDNVITFTSSDELNPSAWKDVTTLESKEKHLSLFNKISTMFSNIRFLYKNVGGIKGLSSSAAITTEGEYALDAREKNASVEGTLANQLDVLNSNLQTLDQNVSTANTTASEAKTVASGKADSIYFDTDTSELQLKSGDKVLSTSKIETGGIKIVTWADGSWEDIEIMLNLHYLGVIDIADYWAVGDTKTISLSAMAATGVDESHAAQDVELTIIGIKHDDLKTAVNGNTKSAITVQLKECLAESGYMNSTATNINGWEGCARRTWCNSVFKASLPSKLQSLIKTVTKETSAGNKSTNIVTLNDDCFLTSAIENGLRTTTSPYNSEGTTYEYYQAESNRIKNKKNGSACSWWERSPLSNSSASFCKVKFDGSSDYDNSQYKSGLAPAFCL